MSKEAVEAIVGRAVIDDAFRETLLLHPDRALAGYDLDEGDLDVLRETGAESLEAFAGSLDERISKSDYQGVLSHGWKGLWAGESGDMKGLPFPHVT